jgi:hypothetical protein
MELARMRFRIGKNIYYDVPLGMVLVMEGVKRAVLMPPQGEAVTFELFVVLVMEGVKRAVLMPPQGEAVTFELFEGERVVFAKDYAPAELYPATMFDET